MESPDGAVARSAPSAPTWFTRPVCIAVLAVAAIATALALPGQSAAVTAGAAAALAVAIAGTAALFMLPLSDRPELVTFLIIGLAGAGLGSLRPGTTGFVIVYMALAGIGMSKPLRLAIPAGLVLFVVMMAAYFAVGAPVTGIATQGIGAAFVFAIGAFTRSAHLAQEQARAAQARAEELLERLRASQRAQAEAAALAERARLAREIHDVLAHALTGLVLALDTMELLGRQAGQDPAVTEKLLEQVAKGQRIAREGLADTKRAIAALRGDELPGPALLDRLVRETAAVNGMRAELLVRGETRVISPEAGLTIYRTAQEALTNSAKYAGPHANVSLTLTYAADQVELAVEDTRADDGPADQRTSLTVGGYGLAGMRERAELLGGSLEAGPTQTGYALRLTLPTGSSAQPARTARPPREGGRP